MTILAWVYQKIESKDKTKSDTFHSKPKQK